MYFNEGFWREVPYFSTCSFCCGPPRESQSQLRFCCFSADAIISDQIEKLKERGVGVKVLKEYDQFVNQSIDDTVKFVYGHAEAFVGNQSVRTLLRSSFRNRVKAVVIDEAHFIVQW